MSGEPKTQDINNTIICNHKCRIPQRMLPGRQRSSPKPKTNEQMKNEGPIHQQRNGSKHLTRTFLSEVRPKSDNRVSDDMSDSIQINNQLRSARPERERLYPAQKSPATPVNKKTLNDKLYGASANKVGRHIITVPVKQKFLSKATNPHKMINLPNQETIMKCEGLDIKQDFSDADQLSNDIEELFLNLNEGESDTSKHNKIIQLKNIWQEKILQFEGMKNELSDRQNAIMEVYASLRSTKERLTTLGQNAHIPSTDDLHIMNIANMTPNQLLTLCAETKHQKNDIQQATMNALTIDMKKLSDMPSKLVATCKQVLETRREFIEWFDNLKNQEKGCSKSTLSKKINEFNAENDILSSSLKNNENEFLKEISDFIRTCWNETIAHQLRNKDLTYELSELNSLNTDLKKQISNFEQQKSYTNKIRVEELEKELKAEKMKRMTMKDRLSRAEGQIKINEERVTILESALNEARAQTRNLERTKQQLLDKNQQLQRELNAELNEVNECLKKNTIQLEEIALAKETLQAEKEDLKNKLEELSKHYNESIRNMKCELNKNTANLIDVEKKYNEEMEQKRHLQTTIESQCAHLMESELRCKETMLKLQKKESELDELLNYKSKFEQIKQELDEKNIEIEEYKQSVLEHTEAFRELEKKLEKLYELENKLNEDIKNKTEHIKELEIKQSFLIHQSQESDSKMEMYEEQLLTLKNHITKLKEHFGEFDNLNDLHELITQQNFILSDTKRKNSELLKKITEKEDTLKHLTETIVKQEELLKEKQETLLMLSEKQEEQTSILQLNEQSIKNNADIETLIKSIESKKDQIDQLEIIILTLEDKNRKATIQKRRDQDKIYELEKKFIEYEHCIVNKNKNLASDDLDNIIKILEDELGTQFDSQILTTNHNHNNSSHNQNFIDRNEHNYEQEQSYFQAAKVKTPTKIMVGNFIKKNHIASNNEKCKIENLGRRQAITKIASIGNKNGIKEENLFQHSKEKLRNIQCIEVNHRDQKKHKMFKFASHQLL